MCINHFIEPSQIIMLQENLVKISLFQTHDENHRKSILITAGLDSLTDCNRSGNTVQYFEILYPELIKQYIPFPSKNKLALIILLEYYIKIVDSVMSLSEEQREVFSTVISRYEKWESTGKPEAASSKQVEVLLERRNLFSNTQDLSTRYKIDYDAILLKFDLVNQISKFSDRLQNFPNNRIFSFTIFGDHHILASYLKPRLVETIEESLARSDVYALDIWITQSDLVNIDQEISVIEQRIAKVYDGLQLEDIFEDKNARDCVLFIFNKEIPSSQITQIGKQFMQKTQQKYLPSLQKKDRLLVLVWANLFGESIAIDNSDILPDIQSFNQNYTKNWFMKILKKESVITADITASIKYLERKLENSRGDPSATYRAMEEALQGLQKGRMQ